MKRSTLAISIPLLCISLTGLTACGFHLRGSQSPAISAEYKQIQLQIPEQAEALHEPLSIYLQTLGATVDQNKSTPILRVTEYQPTRQLLSGRLTEVQLTLKVTFHMEDSEGKPTTVERTIYSNRSYQYDIATVNTDNQEEAHLKAMMNQDIAQQIARQLHADRLQHYSPDDKPAPSKSTLPHTSGKHSLFSKN